MADGKDTIYRQDAIDAFKKELTTGKSKGNYVTICSAISYEGAKQILESLPSAQSTLYGYKIEHLAYIARVMEKEGVTADYAVRTFDDMSRALRMIIEEAQERVMETLNERYDLQTSGD